MNIKNNKILVLAGILILVIIYYCGTQIIMHNFDAIDGEDGTSSKAYVAVITKSTTSDFWKAVQSGVNAAAAEYNISVTFEGPNSEEDYATQNIMIEAAVANGAEIIILSAVDYNANAEAVDYAASQGVEVISIDSDVNSEAVTYKIGTDNYAAGSMAGDAVLATEEEVLRIGIVNFDENSANGQEREEGFRDAVEADSRVEFIETINVLSTTEEAKADTITFLEAYPEINVVVTFNEWTSLGVGYAIEELDMGDTTTVVAFDNNAVSVGMLENGNVDALIVQNPFAMGYLGVEYAYCLLNDIAIEEEELDTQTTLVTSDLMFLEAYQQILFPFS